MLLLLKAVLEKVLHNAAAQMQCLQLPLLEMAAILHRYIILYVKEWYQVLKNDWVVFLSLKCPKNVLKFFCYVLIHIEPTFLGWYMISRLDNCVFTLHITLFLDMYNGTKLAVPPVARATPLFLPPPWNYIHIWICAPFVCPAPNLFCTCNTAFKSRLAPLDMYKYANERLFDLNFLLKLLSKNPKRGKLMRRGDEVKIVYVSSITYEIFWLGLVGDIFGVWIHP